MNPDIAVSNSSLVRGYAWHAYPDPATPGVFAGDNPFGTDDPPGLDRAPVDPPQGVADFWLLNKNTPGLRNDTEGHSFLVLTESLTPPPIVAGWSVEVARIAQDFELDQRGNRSVRLIRILGTMETDRGTIKECEFQVDRG